jgi:hypothetical protein
LKVTVTASEYTLPRLAQLHCNSTAMGSKAGKPDLAEAQPVGSIPRNQAVELGTINYVNLTANQKHGDYEAALAAAAETGKPIFANFVEWSG